MGIEVGGAGLLDKLAKHKLTLKDRSRRLAEKRLHKRQRGAEMAGYLAISRVGSTEEYRRGHALAFGKKIEDDTCPSCTNAALVLCDGREITCTQCWECYLPEDLYDVHGE